MAEIGGDEMSDADRARGLIRAFKGDRYRFGAGVLQECGLAAASAGTNALLVRDAFPGSERFHAVIRRSLEESGVHVAGETDGALPNCPREDLMRITDTFRSTKPDVIVSFGGGSTIDAAKAAAVLGTLGGDIDGYFGTGLVTEALGKAAMALPPHVAMQTAASSAAHLTKYANITDVSTGQKKLIVDDAIVPTHPLFDYELTLSAPRGLTADGALDGIAHALEVLYGAAGKPVYPRVAEIAELAIRLVVDHLPRAMDHPGDRQAREALCLATDLGGYAIMVGGTNGGHLTSFSLVDILSHGRSCAIMNPYYTVFFAPAIEDALRLVGGIYRNAGLTEAPIDTLRGRKLGEAVAKAMFALAARIGFPTRLSEVPGFTRSHIDRALSAAKTPQLRMKLQNMPVPLTAEMIDEYMGPILEAARDGDLSRIRNVP
jgi:alcohol dehydrogenase class IV